MRVAAWVVALLTSAQAGAQEHHKAVLSGVDGQHASVVLTFIEREHRLDIELAAINLPPGRRFALHFRDDRPCPSMAVNRVAEQAIVPDVIGLRADEHGRLYRSFAVDGLSIGPGQGSIVGFPVAIYAMRDDGGAMLACGPVAAIILVTTMPRSMPVPPLRSPADDGACMDLEDRASELIKLKMGEHADVAAATTEEQRATLLKRQAANDVELHSTQETRAKRCGFSPIPAERRAQILQERAAAASAAQ